MSFLFSKTPLIFLVQSFWRDEGFSYFMAKQNLFEILRLSSKDFSPPLYYILLNIWMRLFGSSEIAIRSLSIVFYWGTIYVIFLILQDFFKFSLKKSLIYLLLFIVNPLLVYYGFEARMYSMLAFFASLSFYSFYKKNLKLYLLSSILGIYTHYFMIFVVLGQYLIKRYRQKFVLISFIPWAIFALFQKGVNSPPFWIVKQKFIEIIAFIGKIFLGYENNFLSYANNILPLSIALMILVFVGYLRLKKRVVHDKNLFKMFFVWGVFIPLFIVVISFIKPIFLPRYLIFSVVGLILLLIFIIDKLPNILKISIFICLILVSFNYQKLQIKYRTKGNIRTTLNEVSALMKGGDVLYTVSELDYFTAIYYLSEPKVFIYGKNYSDIPDYVGKTLIPENKVISSLPFYPNKAFILNTSGDYEIQAAY